MIIRSRAPLRIGLGGGGTDLDVYSSRFGGSVVSVTIQLFAHCIIRPRSQRGASFYSADSGLRAEGAQSMIMPLHQGIYRRMLKELVEIPGFDLETFCDVPAGTGLGSSSACVVAQLAAYSKWLNLSIAPQRLAEIAYEIEREEVEMQGGRQDQWSAAYGGFNFFEFLKDGGARASPVLLDSYFQRMLENNLLLFYTGVSRDSRLISEQQCANATQNPVALQSLHTLKRESKHIRELLQKADFAGLAQAMRVSWEAKRKLANGVSTPRLDEIYTKAMAAGALAGKVLGAGGGGFMLFLVDPSSRDCLRSVLESFSGRCMDVRFYSEGASAWTLRANDSELDIKWTHIL